MTPAQRLDRAILAVSQVFGVPVAKLMSDRRPTKSVALARRHLYLACRVTIPVGITQLGVMLGRDHSTLTTCLERFKRDMDADPLRQDLTLHKHILETIYSYPKPEAKEAA